MKKKVKLITTIASLCLAVALMAFGVYAATSVTMRVTSTVKFTVNEVFVEVTGNAYKAAYNADLATVAVEGNQAVTPYARKSYTGTMGTDATPNNAGAAHALETWAIGEIEFTSTEDYIVYVLEIKNVSTEKGVSVTFTDYTPATIAKTTAAAQYVVGDGRTLTGLANIEDAAISVGTGKTLTVVVTRKLDDKTTSFDPTDSWTPNISIVNA